MSEQQFQVSDFTMQAVQATLDWFNENSDMEVDINAETFLANGSTGAFMEVYTQLVVNSVINQDDDESDS